MLTRLRLSAPSVRLCLLATLGASAILAVSPAQAQWKWRDANGRITISDLPPPRGVPDKDVLQRPTQPSRPAAAPAPTAAPTTAATAAANSGTAPAGEAPAGAGAATAPGPAAAARPAGADPELEARKRAAEQAQEAKAKADAERVAAQQRENCERARAQLQALESGQRMARLNAKGEREVLDDAARAEESRRTRQIVASECR